MGKSRFAFPRDFLWGAATCSFSTEGAVTEDGKGLSVWDVFSRRRGAIEDGTTTRDGCDFYHRYPEDIAIMKRLDIRAHRFSISWSRVLPDGAGKVNRKGLDFYDRLVDAHLKAGIIPWVTLFCWDYPWKLHRRGGWLDPASPGWMADYASVAARKLGDRVSWWETLNEPQCYIGLGHLTGYHAPGEKLGWRKVLLASHNLLKGHGEAVRALRRYGRPGAGIGSVLAANVSCPATNRPGDVEAARRATFEFRDRSWISAAWWADPMILGSYPESGLRVFGRDVPPFSQEDLELIRQPLDYFGINFYFAPSVRSGRGGIPAEAAEPADAPRTAIGWPITPEVLYWGPKFCHERYGLPVIVGENGMAGRDLVSRDGKVHDPERIDFLSRYLASLKRAVRDGIPVQGYFHWTLTDNWECAYGYRARFGLIHLDPDTQKRTLKDSALWYSKAIRSRGRAI